MSRTLLLSIIAPLFFTINSFAQVEPNPVQGGDDMVIQEHAIEEFEVKQTAQEELVVTKKGKTFRLNPDAISPEAVEKYNVLTDEQKEAFHKSRKGILTRLAAVLNTQKVTVGFGLAVKNSVVSIIKKEKKERVAYSELGQKFIEGVLDGVNAKLWNESTKIADAKRISFFITPMIQVEGSAPFKLGGAAGISLAVGWDKQKEALFFDLQSNLERFKSGFVFFAGFKVTTGLAFDSAATPERVRNSEVFFPLVLPVWDATGKDYYAFGVSSALSIPPPPFTDVFTYRNTSTRISLNSVLSHFMIKVKNLLRGGPLCSQLMM